jgi:N-acetylneuraminate synthase/N,N'-diacetyllegionaminate synthase
VAARTAAAIGSGDKCCRAVERPNLIPSRRALFATRALTAGEMVQTSDLIALRPGSGIPADRIADVVGRRVTRFVAAGTALELSDVALDAERAGRVA